MDKWWSEIPSERYWLEVTGRDDIGTNLRAPALNEKGRADWRYNLLRSMNVGDIVYHYDKAKSAIVGRSIVRRTVQEVPIKWAAQGTSARQKRLDPYERPGLLVEIEGFEAISPLVTIEDISAKANEMKSAMARLHGEHEPLALYAPFEFSEKRAPRPLQGYVFKLPKDFVSTLDLATAAERKIIDLFDFPTEVGGVPKPHRPVVLLYALERIRRGLPRLMPFEDVQKDLEALLVFVLGAGQRARAHYPFDRLHNQSGLWELTPADGQTFRRTTSRDALVSDLKAFGLGGFSTEVHQAIVASPVLRRLVMVRLLNAVKHALPSNDLTERIEEFFDAQIYSDEGDQPQVPASPHLPMTNYNQKEAAMAYRTPHSTADDGCYPALMSGRDQNIPIYAAIGELLDNSIEHGATDIKVKIEQQDARTPKSVVVCDDGHGMDFDVLSNHLSIGYSRGAAGPADRIGKYGVGAKYAFQQVCLKAEVWSKQKGGVWRKAEFDLEDPCLKKPLDHNYPRDAVEGQPPESLNELWAGLESGTLVQWSNFDRSSLSHRGISEVTQWMERAYRKFIGGIVVKSGKDAANNHVNELIEHEKQIRISINGDRLKAYDPLYLIPFREGDSGGPIDAYAPIRLKYKLSEAAQKKFDKAHGVIWIRIGLSPEDWRPYKARPSSGVVNPPDAITANSAINTEERRIKGRGSRLMDSRRISILRAGREVDWSLPDTFNLGRLDDVDRWFGIEIAFGPELDEAFMVRNVKYQVACDPKLAKMIEAEIKPTISAIRNKISAVWTASEKQLQKQATSEDNGSTGGGGKKPRRRPVSVPPPVSSGDTVDYWTKLLNKWGMSANPDDAGVKRSLVKKADYLTPSTDTQRMFDWFNAGSNINLIEHRNHPAYAAYDESTKLANTTSGQISAQLDESDDDLLITLWEEYEFQSLLQRESLQAIIDSAIVAIALSDTGNNQNKFLKKLVYQWSTHAAMYVADGGDGEL